MAEAITIYFCPDCSYRSLTPGACRSHPYPARAMGPMMQRIRYFPEDDVLPVFQAAAATVDMVNELYKDKGPDPHLPALENALERFPHAFTDPSLLPRNPPRGSDA